MSERLPFGLGTPARICEDCDGAGWVADRQWPSGRDVCPGCQGRRVVPRVVEQAEEAA